MIEALFDFSVGSLNVRGLNNDIKRKAVFEWAKKKSFDVLMLQECYCDEVSSSKWSHEWGTKCFFSHGSKHSRGTMLLFKNGFDVEVLKVLTDTNGRYIIAKVKIEGELFCFVNIYGPTKSNEKQAFFNIVTDKLTEAEILVSDKIIIGGDWNCILNSNIDKKHRLSIFLIKPILTPSFH